MTTFDNFENRKRIISAKEKARLVTNDVLN